MIIDKNKQTTAAPESKETQSSGAIVIPNVSDDLVLKEEEVYSVNALCEVYKAVKKILGDLKREDLPGNPPMFHTIKMNNGQLRRIKHNRWNKEYELAFPAVFLHFINVRYLVQQSRIGEGRATMRIQYVLNRLNNSDAEYELEGYELFQKINGAIQSRKSEFPALAERFQLAYFDQPESFDDGLQHFWIDYEVWFSEFSSYRYKDYVERYLVMPPFTNKSDQSPEIHGEKRPENINVNLEDAASFKEFS